MRLRAVVSAGAVTCLVGIVACVAASPTPRSWDEPTVKIVWPPLPEQPRIEYLGAIRSAEDLGRKLGWRERLKWIVLGREPTSMVKPQAVARNDAGLLVVADPSVPTVHFFQLERREYRRLDPQAASHLRSPVGVAVDDLGRVYVADSIQRKVFVFHENRELVRVLGGESLSRPTGLALSPEQDLLYVVDTIACRVVIFDGLGREVGSFGKRGDGPGEFNAPTHIAVGADGRVSISDSLNFRVQVFEPDGTLVATLGELGDVPGSFARPKGVAGGPGGLFYVVDAAFQNVQIFGSDGRLLLAFGGPGTGAGEFSLPAGMFLDQDGVIWVADSFNKRVQAFRLLGGD
jgi:sugar lactone lactonase YvrE